jgi:hypothetical protein
MTDDGQGRDPILESLRQRTAYFLEVLDEGHSSFILLQVGNANSSIVQQFIKTLQSAFENSSQRILSDGKWWRCSPDGILTPDTEGMSVHYYELTYVVDGLVKHRRFFAHDDSTADTIASKWIDRTKLMSGREWITSWHVDRIGTLPICTHQED